MRQRQALHLKKNDEVVFVNQTSRKEKPYKVHSVNINEADYPDLPVRVTYATPEKFDKKASAVVGYRFNEQVAII